MSGRARCARSRRAGRAAAVRADERADITTAQSGEAGGPRPRRTSRASRGAGGRHAPRAAEDAPGHHRRSRSDGPASCSPSSLSQRDLATWTSRPWPNRSGMLVGATSPLGALVAQAPRVSQAVSTLGASPIPIALGPLYALQLAITYIGLAVPSAAGRLAVNIRFFQRHGLSSGAAVAVGAIDSVAGFIVQISLLARRPARDSVHARRRPRRRLVQRSLAAPGGRGPGRLDRHSRRADRVEVAAVRLRVDLQAGPARARGGQGT